MPSPPSNVTLTATFVSGIHNDGTPPYILYWDSASSTMQVGAWSDLSAVSGTNGKVTRSNLLFFQFGSVIGFTLANNSDAWAAGKVLFNPVTGAPSYATYNEIPRWNGSDTTDGYISSTDYHTLDNVKDGRGDPCKLVGLTVAKIQAGVIDNGLYRLPTNAENIASGYNTFKGTQTANGTTYGLTINSAAASFLLASGYRSTDGSPLLVGQDGSYWSSTAYSDANGYNLYFYSSVYLRSNTTSQLGCAVRCVRQ